MQGLSALRVIGGDLSWHPPVPGKKGETPERRGALGGPTRAAIRGSRMRLSGGGVEAPRRIWLDPHLLHREP
eukprot:12223232-Alexandrium_andersonii.AAC.1